MDSVRKIIAVIISIILFHGILSAQTQKENSADSTYEAPAYCIRAALGLGRSSISFGALAFVRVDIKYVFFSLRACSASELFPVYERPINSANDISALAGLSFTTRFFYTSFGIGIGKVSTAGSIYNNKSSSPSDRYIKTEDSGFGFPIQFDLFWTPGDAFGLGLVFFFNTNRYTSFNGVTLCIQFGKLR